MARDTSLWALTSCVFICFAGCGTGSPEPGNDADLDHHDAPDVNNAEPPDVVQDTAPEASSCPAPESIRRGEVCGVPSNLVCPSRENLYPPVCQKFEPGAPCTCGQGTWSCSYYAIFCGGSEGGPPGDALVDDAPIGDAPIGDAPVGNPDAPDGSACPAPESIRRGGACGVSSNLVCPSRENLYPPACQKFEPGAPCTCGQGSWSCSYYAIFCSDGGPPGDAPVGDPDAPPDIANVDAMPDMATPDTRDLDAAPDLTTTDVAPE